MPTLGPLAALLLASVLPEIEDPLPDRIGLGFPFAMAGVGGVLAGIAINKGGLIGFRLGVLAYLVVLAIQISF